VNARLTFFGAVLVVLAGCATPGEKQIVAQREDIAHRADAQLGAKIQTVPYYQEVDEFYVGGRGVTEAAAGSDPSRLNQPATFRRQYPVTLQMLAEYITTTYGIRVDITPDATAAAVAAAYDPVAALQANRAQQLAQSGAPAGLAPPAAAPIPAAGGAGAILIQYDGDLKGLLDLIASRTGNAWKLSNGAITIFNRDTRTFRIHTLPGASQLSATVSNQSSGGSGGGGAGGGGGGGGAGGGGGGTSSITSGNTTTIDAEINLFESASAAIEGMLSPTGNAVASPALGSITVTDGLRARSHCGLRPGHQPSDDAAGRARRARVFDRTEQGREFRHRLGHRLGVA
jgi:hypothetical protein